MNSFFSFLHLFVQFFFLTLAYLKIALFNFDLVRKIGYDRENSIDRLLCLEYMYTERLISFLLLF